MKVENKKSSVKNFFLLFLFIMAVGFGIYYFAPVKGFVNNVTDQTRAFATLAIGGKKEQVRGFIDEKVLPKDPEEERSALIEKLKTNIEEIKRSELMVNNFGNFSAESGVVPGKKDNPAALVGDSVADKNNSGEGVENLIKNSEEIIKQLESVNNDKTVARTAVNRILDVILPLKEGVVECGK